MNPLNVKKIIVAIVMVLIVCGVGYALSPMRGGTDEKEVTLTVLDGQRQEILLDHQVFKTTASSLGEFLRENREALQLEAEESEYGLYITGILGLSAKDNGASGPFWLYGYESKTQGITMPIGQAPSADQLMLYNQDEITFSYTSEMESGDEG